MKKVLFTLLAAMLLSGCAKDIVVNYPGNGKGSFTMQPTKNVYQAHVLVNDSLVVENKTVKSVTLKGLPDGDHRVVFRSNYSYYKGDFNKLIKATIGPEQYKQHKDIVVPGYNASYYIINAALFVLILTPAVAL